MYKEIHPYYYDFSLMWNDTHNGNSKKPAADYYKPTSEPLLLRLDTIKQIRKETVPDEQVDIVRLKVSDDYHDDILVCSAEAEEIKKALLSGNPDNTKTANELHYLTAAIRDLWQLLRARLH